MEGLTTAIRHNPTSTPRHQKKPAWWRCYPLYWQSFAQGSRDLLRLPAQSLPFVLSLALMLALFLTIASLSRSLLVQPVPGIHKIEQIQLIQTKLDIGPAVMNMMNKEMLPGLQQALAGPGEFSFLGFGTGKLKLAQQHDVVTVEANAGAAANLGVPLILGQPPIDANNRHEVWLSEALWQHLFASDPNIIGQSLQLDEETLTIRGVLAHFVGHQQAKNNQPLQLWRFYQLKDLGPLKARLNSNSNNLLLYRHPESRTLDTAAVGEWLTHSKETAAFMTMFSGENMTPAISQQPYLTWIQGESATLALVLLAVALVLLVITVLNLTNLCAGRFTSRQRDMALQLVAGCSIGRLRWLLYLELLAWTLPALLMSVLLALWLLRVMPTLTGNLFPIIHHLQVSSADLIVLVVVVGILTSTLSWPLVPKSLQHQLQPVLAGSGKGMQQHKGLSKTALFSQLGLSAVLVLTAASLTLSGYLTIYTNQGYRLSNAEYFNLDQSLDLDEEVAANEGAELDPKKAAAEEKMRHQAWLELQQRLQKKMPQHQVILSTGMPFHSRFFAETVMIPPKNNERMVVTTVSEPSLHQAFGMTLLHGRWLTPADAEAAKNLRPILINQQLAQQQFTLWYALDLRQPLHAEQRRSHSELVRVLSHELRNSLTPMASMTQTLLSQQHWQEPQVRQVLQRISERASRLLNFISAYREVNQLPAPQPRWFRLDELTQNCADLLSCPVQFQGLDWCYADPLLFEQLLLNLLKNAVEAQQQLSSDVVINLSFYREGMQQILQIEDQGPGFANPANLFTPFYTTKAQGLGVGLTLCRDILHLHQGELQARNLSAGGACLTASWPAADVSQF